MNSGADLLAQLPHWAFAFMLVFSRVGSAMMLLPGLGESQIPARLRLAIALGLSVLVLPPLMPLMPAAPAAVPRAVALIAGEIVTGLWFGMLARLVMFAWPMAGDFIAYMIGLTSVFRAGNVGTEVSNLYALAAPALLLATGLYALPILALVRSYHTIGPGLELSGNDAAQVITAALATSFSVAFQLAAPFILAGIVWQVALGLLTRLVPSIQVYFVALPAQILGGIFLLGALSLVMTGGFANFAREALAHLGAAP